MSPSKRTVSNQKHKRTHNTAKERMDILHELISSPINFAWAVVGALLTMLATHLLSKDRDKSNRTEAAKSAAKTRRKEFCSFLRGWQADFGRLHMQQSGYSRSGAAFVTVIPSFVQKSDLVRGDISGDAQKRFGELVAAIAARNGGAVGNKEPYEQLLKDFDELLSIAENAS